MEEKFLSFRKDVTLPFPEQFISLLDKTAFYIYTTKIADDIAPAALLWKSRHMPLSITAVRREEQGHRAGTSTDDQRGRWGHRAGHSPEGTQTQFN